jgi:hypothetical protein
VNTVLREDGMVGIPEEIRRNDHLLPGDSFNVQRVSNGRYLLSKETPAAVYRIETAADGLPVVRAEGKTITSELVRTIQNLPE